MVERKGSSGILMAQNSLMAQVAGVPQCTGPDSGFVLHRVCRLDPSAKDAEGDDDDDAVPDLVENFEEVSQVRSASGPVGKFVSRIVARKSE
jgi:hypothetical protein